MTSKPKKSLYALALSTLTALGGYGLHAYADGAPTAQPVWYAGSVSDPSGTPLTGSHQVWLRLYTQQTGASATLCTTGPSSIPFEKGRFRVEVSGACVDVMKKNPDLFVEVSVDDDTKPFPRAKVGAVPYALEAQHAMTANEAVGALKERLDRLPIITEWKPFSPELYANGQVLPRPADEGHHGMFRRVGDSVEARVYITGTKAFAGRDQVSFNLPNGLKVNRSKLTPAGTRVGAGSWIGNDANGVTHNWLVVSSINSEGRVQLVFDERTNVAGTPGNVSPTTPFDVGRSGQAAFSFTAPVEGWTSSSPIDQP